ncbi:MAG: hypothetical protein M3Z84_05740, partial [Actinomycetota bacterium]|nr:hypothetical protein [Actinomycetota bacterium]
MRRFVRPLFFAGIVAVVFGLAKAHALRHGYDFTNSFRFAWSFAYIGLLVACAYGAGLPELARNRRSVAIAAVASTAAAAAGMSLLQLLAGSALLPRFVVFSAPLVLVPFAVLCADLSR